MRKLIAVGGVPASGKTTLMRKFLSGRERLQLVKPRKLVSAMHDPDINLFVLGEYTQTDVMGFEGTDKLSMAVQPEAMTFLEQCKDNILFEGDRLFNQSFLDRAVELSDDNELELHVIVIQTNPKLVEQRHIDRKDIQSEQFKRGRQTKIDNICSSFILMPYITYLNNDTEEDLQKNVNYLKSLTE